MCYNKTMEISKSFNFLPLSDWHIYGTRRNGAKYLKPEARAQKEEIGWLFKGEKMSSKKRFGMEIIFRVPHKRNFDLNRRVGIITDALEGIIYKNDNQITELFLYKESHHEEKTEISVYSIK